MSIDFVKQPNLYGLICENTFAWAKGSHKIARKFALILATSCRTNNACFSRNCDVGLYFPGNDRLDTVRRRIIRVREVRLLVNRAAREAITPSRAIKEIELLIIELEYLRADTMNILKHRHKGDDLRRISRFFMAACRALELSIEAIELSQQRQHQ